MPELKPKEINSEVYTYIEIIFEFYRMVTPIMIFWILKIVRNEHHDISFSYRRMFGAIEIADREHSGLVEKVDAKVLLKIAYRQLQAILKNFFCTTCRWIFQRKQKTAQSEFFNQKKDEFNAYQCA